MTTLACIGCGGILEVWWVFVVAIPFVGKWIKKKWSKNHD